MKVIISTAVLALYVHSALGSVTSCLKQNGVLSSNILTSSSHAWDSAIQAYNQRLNPVPGVFVRAQNEDNVVASVKCATENGYTVSAKGGGHSYAASALGGVSDSKKVVVDLFYLNKTVLNDDGTAVVGGGVKLGDMAVALNKEGRGAAHGTCPFVGVGGHAGYGGYGYASRMWGLAVDQVYAYDVVLANGTLIKNLSEGDLFWALKGNAPDYGIVTNYYIKTHEVPSSVVNFKYTFDKSLTAYHAAKAFIAYQKWVASSPAEISFSAILGKGYIEFSGVYYGTMDNYNSVSSGFVSAIGAAANTTVTQSAKSLSWVDSLQDLAGSQKLSTLNQKDTRDTFYAKSLFTPESAPITQHVAQAYFKLLWEADYEDLDWWVEIDVYGGTNSQINKISLSESSFAHRDKLLNFQMYASSSNYSPPYPDDGFAFMNTMFNTITDGMADVWGSADKSNNIFGSYVCYVDPQLSKTEVARFYWPSQYSKLQDLKTQYDPSRLFTNSMSVTA